MDTATYSIGFLVFVGAVVMFILLITAIIVRWIFSINRFFKKADVMIDLLFTIAQKNGATEEELAQARKFYLKSFK